MGIRSQMFKPDQGAQGLWWRLHTGAMLGLEAGQRDERRWGGDGKCHSPPRAGWAAVPGAAGGGCHTTVEDIWWQLAKLTATAQVQPRRTHHHLRSLGVGTGPGERERVTQASSWWNLGFRCSGPVSPSPRKPVFCQLCCPLRAMPTFPFWVLRLISNQIRSPEASEGPSSGRCCFLALLAQEMTLRTLGSAPRRRRDCGVWGGARGSRHTGLLRSGLETIHCHVCLIYRPKQVT